MVDVEKSSSSVLFGRCRLVLDLGEAGLRYPLGICVFEVWGGGVEDPNFSTFVIRTPSEVTS